METSGKGPSEAIGIIARNDACQRFFRSYKSRRILPFIGVLTAPDRVFNHAALRRLVATFGINSPDQLVAPLAVAFAVTALVAGSMRLLLLWATARLSNAIGADLSIEMYRRTLYQPYRLHVVRNSSEVIDGITNKSWIAVSMLQSALTLTSFYIATFNAGNSSHIN